MARIVGVDEGLRAGSMVSAQEQRKIVRAPETKVCKHCDGVIPLRKHRSSLFAAQLAEELNGSCVHCAKLFDTGMPFPYDAGVTSLSPEDSIKRIAELRSIGWGIILRSASFGHANGTQIEIEPGDIVKIHRAGISDLAASVQEMCSHWRSKERFSIEVMIGPIPLVLWPHEIAPITFLVIMDLKKAGEIQESFVAQEDECGYFKPTDELRAQIYDLFGRMTGEPPR